MDSIEPDYRRSREIFANLDHIAVGPFCVNDNAYSEPPFHKPSRSTSASLCTNSSPSSKGKSPESLSYHHSGPISSSWVVSPNEEIIMNHSAPHAFNYGDWENWTRMDGAADALSPIRLKQSPSIYAKNNEMPPIFRPPGVAATQSSPVQDQLLDQTTSSIDAASLSATQSAPFTFGANTSTDAPFTFEESLNAQPLPPPAQIKGFYPDNRAWVQESPMDQSSSNSVMPLTVEQQEHLRNIAFSTVPAATNRQSTSSSPEPNRRTNSRKRKSSSDNDSVESPIDSQGTKKPAVKKTAHNMIEKRYRTNLNDKIAALRDSVPSLRIMSRGKDGNVEEEDDPEDLEGLTPAHKLNKATVLSKATEYIRHLEKRLSRSDDENAALKTRLSAFEKLAMAGSIGTNNGPAGGTNGFRYQYNPFSGSDNNDYNATQASPEGMIQVPEDIRRLHAGQLQQQYSPRQTEQPVYQAYRWDHQSRPMETEQQQNGQNRGGGGLMSKLMVGSLAGLMIMEGYNEREQSKDTPAGRGLFSIPVEVLGVLGNNQRLQSTVGFGPFGGSSPFQSLFLYLKMFLVLGAVIYIISPQSFDKTIKQNKKKSPTARLAGAPSLASPVEVRRRAWLTAIQTVWVPRHNLILEVAALGLKTLKLNIRNLAGWEGYAWLTGLTEEHENARVKAWEIALDAQLAGGDEEISKLRLLLTLMASGTMPDTPARMMLKALHINILLWKLGSARYGTLYFFDKLTATMARSQWNGAQKMHKARIASDTKGSEDEDALPGHLAKLLEMECDEVMVDGIIQRAYDLAWNRPIIESPIGDKDGMNDVVEDLAIRSPLDALGAWWSSMVLHRALVTSFKCDTQNGESVVAEDIDLAISTAPPASGAHVRALLARAVLIEQHRQADISAALDILPSPSARRQESSSPTFPGSIFFNSPNPSLASTDVHTGLLCAMSLALLNNAPASAEIPRRLMVKFNNLHLLCPNLGILGFVSAYRLLTTVVRDDELANQVKQGVEHAAGALRVWVGGELGRSSGLRKSTRAQLVEECLSISRKMIGLNDTGDESDAGYASLTEIEGDQF
ncbi:MAG: hypothetical protein M1827_004146 [Pycnora praestabilis]|nr:MAG: hypothetical protein M1827_004146 [Pycnora praestabilis]